MDSEAAEPGFALTAAPQQPVRELMAKARLGRTRKPELGEGTLSDTIDHATDWRDGHARNQALFRQVNERIEELAGRFGAGGPDHLICECGNPECTQPIEMTAAEYERVRKHASRFVVAPNHENPETETIVEENERFAVVETYAGGASRIARETDPRSQVNLREHAH